VSVLVFRNQLGVGTDTEYRSVSVFRNQLGVGTDIEYRSVSLPVRVYRSHL
jgi:hypothetical protein